jgi:hypothetical protein
MRVLNLKGTARERGREHGVALRPLITRAVHVWKTNLAKSVGMDPDLYIREFLEEAGIVSAAKASSPGLVEEISGIGEGAGVDFNTIFAWQCLDEEYWYRIFEKKVNPTDTLGSHCSVIGVPKEGGGESLLGGNADIANEYDGLQVLLHINDSISSLDYYMFGFAGMTGIWGLSKSGIGICANTVLDLNHAKGALAVPFIIRGVLERRSLDDATDFVKDSSHASGQNYMIADADRVIDLECSAHRVVEFAPSDNTHRVYHTNHSIANEDRVPSAEEIDASIEPFEHTKARYNFLRRNLEDLSKNVDMNVIREILTSHEVPTCFHNTGEPRQHCTAATVIMSLSKVPELRIGLQPPCRSEWQRFTF